VTYLADVLFRSKLERNRSPARFLSKE
jgi:stalled ribosome alternative rescue factor ArfA